ncbi:MULTISPECIES: DUF5642 family protein [Mycolicibacterium]|uniref:Conserved exported protein of uncharacterized function n=1 Tax=Mycolicibacterium gilvum TaxID=1804 RepID=A0A378STU1_9MYCO|nr:MULTISPECIES: DUF5642 family protein [Mycolicibacterium]MBV5244249.1 DUF5642 family protein [Mycolicibacterium sp. PAM1]MCV7055496.1 DUF5642 family protein [Mycolicibacterium gilvum]STZ45274.1 Conserved exported protein of uncharacterised function [Mycolicibacterium gilvum]
MSNAGKYLALPVAAVVGLSTACNAAPAEDFSKADIARVAEVKSGFAPSYTVNTVGPAAIDPRFLTAQKLPPGLTFDPQDCAKSATENTVPEGVKGNMAATTAEGDGVRYIVIAVETSEAVPVNTPSDQCRKVTFTGAGMRGLVEVVEAPAVDGVTTVGTHRVLQTVTEEGPRTGELYNYVATFGNFIVIVTANPLVVADKPVARIDTQRARDLVTQAVGLVKG